MASITLDVVVRPGETAAGTAAQLASLTGTTAEVVQEHGPGGGNPEITFTGTREALEYLVEQYEGPCMTGQDFQDTVARIKD